MPGFLAASLAPRIRADFAFGDATLGLAVALFYVVSASGSVPAGRLVDRVGAAWGMRLAAALTAISCLAIATLAQSAASLTALMLIGGVANALGGPSVSALLKREVAVRRQGLAFGAQQAGAPLGALLAGLALPAVAIPFGWPWAFLVAAAPALVAVASASRTRATADRSGTAGRRPRGFTSVHALGVAAVLASAAGVGFLSFLVTYAGGQRNERGGRRPAAGRRQPRSHDQQDRARRLRGPRRAGAAAAGGDDAPCERAGLPAADRGRAGVDRGCGAAGRKSRLALARGPHPGRRPAQPARPGLGRRRDDDRAVRGRGGRGRSSQASLAEEDLFALAWIACACLALLAAATIAATLRREARRP